MNKHVERALDELCRYVGTTYAAVDAGMVRDPEGRKHWPYAEYSWSSAAEACFIGWLENELKRRTFMRGLTGNGYSTAKKRRQTVAAWFNLNYGWRSEQ